MTNTLRRHPWMLIAAWLLSLWSAGSLAGGDGWRLEKEQQGITVFTRAEGDSDFRAFRGVAVVPGELNQVMAVLDDTANFSNWMHNCDQALLLEKRSLLDRVQYLRLDFPWPASDRDMILRNEISQDPSSRVVTIDLSAADAESLSASARQRLPEGEGVQRVAQVVGRYVLTPIDSQQTRVEFEMAVDPGGALPASVVNAQLIDNPYETLLALREQVQQARYRHFNPF